MGLVKRTYVDGETVITADNLNDIQDEIIQNASDISTKGTYSKPSGGIPSTDMTTDVQTSLGKADTAYQKPSGGIPSTDLASAVQTSLGKADTAYQKPSGGIPSTDMASAVQTSLGKADSAYQKPSGGIPATDMASGVQTSLGKADTALQSSDIDNTLSVTGKAADAKKTGDEISGLKNTLNQLDAEVDTIESGLAIPQTGDTASQSIPDGAFIYLTGNSNQTDLPNGFYQNTSGSAIGSGTTFTLSNLTRCYQDTGAFNIINAMFSPSSYRQPTNIHSAATLGNGGYVQIGKLVIVNCRFAFSTSTTGSVSIAKFPLPKSGDTMITATNNRKLDIGMLSNGFLSTTENISTGPLIVTTAYIAK